MNGEFYNKIVMKETRLRDAVNEAIDILSAEVEQYDWMDAPLRPAYIENVECALAVLRRGLEQADD